MLEIHPEMLEMLRELRPILAELERRDADLARQLRRAAPSVVLNTAEAMYSRGKNRAVRYHSALGSAREVLACLEVAEAFGYLRGVERRMEAAVESDHRNAGAARSLSAGDAGW